MPRNPALKRSRRGDLARADAIDFSGSNTMAPCCRQCRKRGRPEGCLWDLSVSSKCNECNRTGVSCTLLVTASEYSRLRSQRDKIDLDLAAAERALIEATARWERLRKLRAAHALKEKDLLQQGLDAAEEFERQENSISTPSTGIETFPLPSEFEAPAEFAFVDNFGEIPFGGNSTDWNIDGVSAFDFNPSGDSAGVSSTAPRSDFSGP